MNLISVVIPAYNAEKTIKECLLSVKNQTHKNVEIILVDDDSNDNTIKVANLFYMEFKDELDMTIIKLDENSGPGAARNKGIELSKGNYITFVDSDDIIHPLFCEVFLDEIVKNDADLVTSKNFRFKDEYNYPNVSNAKFKLMEDPVLFIKKSGTSACATLYKKSSINLKFPERMIGEDTIFTSLYLSTPRKIIFTEDVFYGYRLATKSSITSADIDDFKIDKIVDKLKTASLKIKIYIILSILVNRTRKIANKSIFISKNIPVYLNLDDYMILFSDRELTAKICSDYLTLKEQKYGKAILKFLETNKKTYLLPFYVSSFGKLVKNILRKIKL